MRKKGGIREQEMRRCRRSPCGGMTRRLMSSSLCYAGSANDYASSMERERSCKGTGANEKGWERCGWKAGEEK